MQRIVVVGGGAGGLELVTRLGRTLGRSRKAEIFLVDRQLTHLWKPLLHEVAAGTLRMEDNELNYLAQASWNHFRFRFGTMDGLDRAKREIYLAPTYDDDGNLVNPRRVIPYDTLVMAAGSLTDDFATPGVKEYATSLNEPRDARRFHRRLLAAAVHSQIMEGSEPLNVVIVGAGATGVELSAELHNTMRQFVAYGLDKIDPERIRISVVEAGPRILSAVPPELSAAVQGQLRKIGIHVYTGERVTEVGKDFVLTTSGLRLPATFTIWAAGIKAPDFLKDLDGLECNRSNQLLVKPNLQTTRDPAIFALGDCAACRWEGHEGNVPPRAQAAHQQATLLAKSLLRQTQGKPLLDYHYRDFGSLVSLGRYEVVGNLMGKVTGRGIMIEGLFARFMYWSLYQLHLLTLHGWSKVMLSTLAQFIHKQTQPRVKLH